MPSMNMVYWPYYYVKTPVIKLPIKAVNQIPHKLIRGHLRGYLHFFNVLKNIT